MRYRQTVPAVLVFLVFLFSPVLSFSEVVISLKNGREIIAESCGETKGSLVCQKMGGSFEIDKKDVLTVKGIAIGHASSSQVSEEIKGQGPESGEKETFKSEEDLKGDEKQPNGDLVKGLKPDEEKRLGQINMKKIEYQAERQRLINDRQQLQEDLKNTGLISKAELDALNKRIADLETRLNTFNEEVRKLNEEGRKILESSKNNNIEN